MDEAALRNLVLAGVRDFVDWAYDEGPNPDEMPREKLIERYLESRGQKIRVVK